jgi:hypothetical protein
MDTNIVLITTVNLERYTVDVFRSTFSTGFISAEELQNMSIELDTIAYAGGITARLLALPGVNSVIVKNK